jgi:ParB family chromosome partitioning protein
MTTTKAAKTNVYSNLGSMLAEGFNTDLQSDESDIDVSLEDVDIAPQIRGVETMEDDEQTLADLGRSLRKRQAQAIVLRANPNPGRQWLLVAGERRVRAARIEGLTHLRARVMTLTDEEAADLQTAENIHRKNLTQMEEARKVQHDLQKLGSIEAVLDKHQKSRAWFSKLISLLDLPEQAKRLLTENVSADLEVINTVKLVEKADPAKARALVEDLKATRGKENARVKVQAVKEQVKPSKKPKPEAAPVAAAKDRSPVAAGKAKIFAGAKIAGSPVDLLEHAYVSIREKDQIPVAVLRGIPDAEGRALQAWLEDFYTEGQKAKDPGRVVLQGFRTGQFAAEGAGAFALVAFLQGIDADAEFNVLKVLGSVKQ